MATPPLETVDSRLARNPRDIAALIQKADHLAAGGDVRGASAFYLRAVNLARDAPVPSELRAEVARAKAMCERLADTIEAGLRERLSAGGFAPRPELRRFAESLDIMFGHREPYFQQPLYYFFPGLPQIQFYERSAFPWLRAIEAHTGAIREELAPVMADAAAFRPYIQRDPSRPHHDQAGMTDNRDWSAFYLWKDGKPVAGNAERCPRTLEALRDVPFPRVANRSPSILFSLLRPGAHIPAHHGFMNTRLICHLPLVVPAGCSFRVGNETREWVEGEALVFDDTIEHEAWNRSAQARVVLLFELWRPELSAEERAWVTAMFEAIDAQGARVPWQI